MNMRLLLSPLAVCLLAVPALAAEYSVEVLKEGPPEEVSPEIAKLLSPTGLKVMKGGTRTVCQVWLRKDAPAKAGFKATPDVNYPFSVGELIGVARYINKGGDFRDQDIDKGVYTMRYAQQPVDGAHIGTSPTRDFLLLISAKVDKKPAMLDYEPLVEESAAAAGSTHPCLLSMQRVQGDEKAPLVRVDETNDWTILRIAVPTKAGDKAGTTTVDLVVVGHFAE